MENGTTVENKCQCETSVCGTGNLYYYNCGGLVPSIGENGNWFIGCKDTGVSATGTPGKDGRSAYEVAVEHGFTGTAEEWLASLKGAEGAPGARGPQGATGPQGPAGPQGPKGEDGTSLRYDVLFDGIANMAGSSYPLRKSVSGYRLVVVFCALHKKADNTFVQKNGMVLAGEDIVFMDASGWSVMFQEQASISATFTDSTTMKVTRVELGGYAASNIVDYIAVTRVLGIY